jgi:uncharacterized protein YycO
MRTPHPPQGRKAGQLIGVLAAAGAIVLASADLAMAAPVDKAFNRLLKLNPGLSAAELRASLREAAAANGMTYEKAVKTALAEAERNRDIIFTQGGSKNPKCKKVEIGVARNKGDVFYSAASTYGVPHGHMGIFSARDWVTEARGPGQKSDKFRVAGRRYCARIDKMEVSTTQAKRNRAGDYAARYLVKKPYNRNFAWNKGKKINKLNCSELVYKAYKRSVKIDLDGDGGLGVYPNDIRKSKRTYTYQVRL